MLVGVIWYVREKSSEEEVNLRNSYMMRWRGRETRGRRGRNAMSCSQPVWSQTLPAIGRLPWFQSFNSDLGNMAAENVSTAKSASLEPNKVCVPVVAVLLTTTWTDDLRLDLDLK